MKQLSFDSVGGASGDMLLAALIDLGADASAISAALNALVPLEPLAMLARPASAAGLHGTRVTVVTLNKDQPGHWADADAASATGAALHEHPHRCLADIVAILIQAKLPPRVRQLACATFERLAEAEGAVHGKPVAEIHFHELGATDAIADVVGCCLALELLDVEAVRVGPLPSGCGTLQCAHGEMPNPAPATVRLLANMLTVQTDEPFELVTPTGAALLGTWCAMLPAPPSTPARVVRSGYGFGQRTLHGRPNLLRATLLDSAPSAAEGDITEESLTLLETNLDDCNPQWIGDLIERALTAGALDAWATPMVMKKGRPALLLSVLCQPDLAAPLRRLIFKSTPTFGIRTRELTRHALPRRFETVETPYGPVRVKIGLLDGREITRTPEFEDCAARARENDVAPREVAAYANRPPSTPPR